MAAPSRIVAVGVAALLAACAGVGYAPCPVDCARPLTVADFGIARDLLATRFGALAVADEASFRLQTKWCAVTAPVGERRATIFRDGDGFAVVVELRPLVEPVVGMPYWAPARGDTAAERELADLLGAELAAAAR